MAQTTTINGITYTLDDNINICTVTGYTQDINSDIEIPSSIEENGKKYYVTSIGNGAFDDFQGLEKVVIEGHFLQRINDYAFRNCSNLKQINIPNSIKFIASGAFANCKNLTYIEDDGINYLGDIEKHQKTVLMSVKTDRFSFTTSEDTKIIYGDAFQGLQSLNDINITDNVIYIGSYAFANCSNLIKAKYPIREEVGSYVFDDTNIQILEVNCFCDTQINFPSLKTLIINDMTNGSVNIELSQVSKLEEITLPRLNKPMRQLLDANYFNYPSLKKIVIKQGDKLPEAAFEGLDTVEEIELPETITAIPTDAFGYCSKLVRVNLSNVLSIGLQAFRSCKAIENINIDKVTSLGNNAFKNCTSLQTIVFPESIISLGESIFENCTSLQTIVFPESITVIPKSLAKGCSSLKVDIPSHITEIGDEAFAGCSSISDLIIPDSLTYIGENAFSSCGDIGSVNIPFVGTSRNSNDTTFNTVFGTSNIENVIIRGGKIGQNAFSNRGDIKNISLPQDITYIGKEAFNGCSNLRELHIPPSVINIEEIGLFAGCDKLTNITIPYVSVSFLGNFFDIGTNASNKDVPTTLEKVNILHQQTFGTQTFGSCSQIKEINVCGTGVKFNSTLVFNNCTGLKKLSLPVGTTFVYGALGGCEALEELTIPCKYDNFYNLFHYYSQVLPGEAIRKIPNTLHTVNLIGGNIINTDYFYGCTNILSLNIHKAWGIEKGALSHLNQLKELTLPFLGYSEDIDNGKYFGYVFGEELLYPETKTKIPNTLESVTILGENLPTHAFMGYDSIKNIHIKTPVISSEAINMCNNINTIILEGSTIESKAINMCNNINTIILEGSTIESKAINMCNNIGEINIKSTVTSIQKTPFFKCTNLLEIVVDNDNQNYYIEDNCLIDKPNNRIIIAAQSAQIPEGIKIIDEYTFYNNQSTTISIPQTVTEIHNNAFAHCKNLEEVIVPDSVSLIGEGAFAECDNLSKITLPFIGRKLNDTTNEKYFGYIFGYSDQVQTGSRKAENTPLFNVPKLLNSITIQNGEEIIADAFNSCNGVKEIQILNMNSIGKGAMHDCVYLEKLTIPFIGQKEEKNSGESDLLYHFGYIFGYNEVAQPSSFDNIYEYENKYYEFLIPRTLEEVHITNSNKINSPGFYGCLLKNISLNDEISLLENSVFANCQNLEYVKLPSMLESIPEHLFAKSGLRTLAVPSLVGPIGAYAFANCEHLSEITFGEKTTEIGEKAFEDCISLERIKIPNSVLKIGSGIFKDCYGLKQLITPFIGESANAKEEKGILGYFFDSNLGKPEYEQYLTLVSQYYNSSNKLDTWIPNSLVDITVLMQQEFSYGTFSECKNLQNISLSRATKLNDNCFKNCEKASYIDVGQFVTHVGTNAFYGCSALETISLPISISIIETGAFINTPKLKTLFIHNDTFLVIKNNAFEDKTYKTNAIIYLLNTPKSGIKNLPVSISVPDIRIGETDFLGFWFDGVHSLYNLNVYRVINNRINEPLTPTKKDITMEVPGRDGSYYFGSYNRSKVFNIDFAFDKLTEEDLHKWKNFCANKELSDLIFDECPYKVYKAKITGRPILKYIAFEENGRRVYKGEGTLEFTCYYPYAHTIDKNTKIFGSLWQNEDGKSVFSIDGRVLSNYPLALFPSKQEWAEASRLYEYYPLPEGFNPGDMPSPFKLTTTDKVKNGDKLKVGNGQITIKQDTDKPVTWDSKIGIVYYIDDKGKQIVVPHIGNSLVTIPVNTKGVEVLPKGSKLEYDFWYY